MIIDLTGRRAVVSGSTAGIGRATAEGLARAGASVVINGRGDARVAQALSEMRALFPAATIEGVAADLATAQGVEAFVAQAADADILVNNLGRAFPRPFQEIADADWLNIFQTNVMSGVRMTRHYLPVEDVRPGILRDSTLTTYCPYKGTARYHSVELNGRLHEDIVWTYPDPNGEVAKIRGLLAFYNEKVEAVLVDGRPAAPRFPMRI